MGVGKAGLKSGEKPDILVVLLPQTCSASFLFTKNHFKSACAISLAFSCKDAFFTTTFIILVAPSPS